MWFKAAERIVEDSQTLNCAVLWLILNQCGISGSLQLKSKRKELCANITVDRWKTLWLDSSYHNEGKQFPYNKDKWFSLLYVINNDETSQKKTILFIRHCTVLDTRRRFIYTHPNTNVCELYGDISQTGHILLTLKLFKHVTK